MATSTVFVYELWGEDLRAAVPREGWSGSAAAPVTSRQPAELSKLDDVQPELLKTRQNVGELRVIGERTSDHHL